ncbi:hypothetical protein BJF78_25935 [Pseudonocardia sp. CNS-139]|nr:hypothetical protein BJF78_25935 [Pseudonocardia sp. CNS-139]
MMSAPRSGPENPTAGLTPITGDHDVVVTGEEHHQAALRPYAPHPGGRAAASPRSSSPRRSATAPTPAGPASRSAWTGTASVS